MKRSFAFYIGQGPSQGGLISERSPPAFDTVSVSQLSMGAACCSVFGCGE